jgi:FkbM family methyltransferase
VCVGYCLLEVSPRRECCCCCGVGSGSCSGRPPASSVCRVGYLLEVSPFRDARSGPRGTVVCDAFKASDLLVARRLQAISARPSQPYNLPEMLGNCSESGLKLLAFVGAGMLTLLLVMRLQLTDEEFTKAVEGPKVSFARPASSRKLYLDLGANCGNSYEFFKVASPQVMTLVTPEFDAYLFEPQPEVFKKWLIPLQESVGERMHVYNMAVATVNASISFGVDLNPSDFCSLDGRGYPHGASSIYGNIRGPGATLISVPSIDFGDFFAGLQVQPDDFVIVKIDIEAQEYVILRQLQQLSLLCLVDELFVEWHDIPSEVIALDADMRTFRRHFEETVTDCVGYYQEWSV